MIVPTTSSEIPVERAVELVTSALAERQGAQTGPALPVDPRIPTPVIEYLFTPTQRPRTPTFVLKQQWEGQVTSIGEEQFGVRLKDLTHPENPPEVAELAVDDVHPSDRHLLQEGAVLYWSIGFEDTHRGRERKSIIRFRRLPGWTQTDVEALETRTASLKAFLQGDDDGPHPPPEAHEERPKAPPGLRSRAAGLKSSSR